MKIIWNFYGANLTWRHDEPQRERSILLSCSGLGHKSTKSFWPWIWSWSTVGGLWGLIPSTASVAYFGQYTSAVAQKDFLLSAENEVGSILLFARQWAASWSFQEEVDGFPLKTSNEAVARRKYFKVSTLLYKHILIKDLLDPLDRWSELLLCDPVDSSIEVRRKDLEAHFCWAARRYSLENTGIGEDYCSLLLRTKLLTSAALDPIDQFRIG